MEKDIRKSNSIKKIAIVGPESTGKSTLAKMLARHYNTIWVEEYARKYIDNLSVPYQKHDLDIIAKGQIRSEDELIESANRILICDTNLIVIKIWSEHKYGFCEEWIINELSIRRYHLHLLTYIDLPWEEDPQREHPDKREYFYELYKTELVSRKFPYAEIKGNIQDRFTDSVSAINTLL
jgi:NadR type nicotinamide-nucleotide adenylyltransferase